MACHRILIYLAQRSLKVDFTYSAHLSVVDKKRFSPSIRQNQRILEYYFSVLFFIDRQRERMYF